MNYKRLATKDDKHIIEKVSKRMVKISKKIDSARVPKHVAFIMDGNGRWARKRGQVRTYGHKFGYAKMIMAVKRCVDLGIGVCSIFGFSTENWNRPKEEIDEIFRIIRENMSRDSKEFMKYGIKVVTMGDITRFPKDMQDKLVEVIEETKNNTECILNFCINYGGRADIVRAANLIVNDKSHSNNKTKSKDAGRPKEITEQEFSKYLYGSDLPEPDLIIRTSGEMRISNFMLWQMAYSEFLFIKKYWPDVNEKLIDKCVAEYQKRKRRYGKV